MRRIVSLAGLLRLAPPPQSPVDAGTRGEWEKIEKTIGSQLPEDFNHYTNIYGSGDFGDFLVPLSPFAKSDKMNLLEQTEPFLDIYRDGLKSSLSVQCPFSTYPESGGLLPLARDLNGGDLFWRTEGSPSEWTLVHYDWRGGYDYQTHPMNFVEFLYQWLSGKLPESFFGGDTTNIKRNPLFCPSNQIRSSSNS